MLWVFLFISTVWYECRKENNNFYRSSVECVGFFYFPGYDVSNPVVHNRQVNEFVETKTNNLYIQKRTVRRRNASTVISAIMYFFDIDG